MLALSMVVGITGAWFADKEAGHTENNQGVFGHVEITQSSATGDWGSVWTNLSSKNNEGKLLPGSTLTVKGGTVTVSDSANEVPVYILVRLSNIVVEVYDDSAFKTKNTELSTGLADYLSAIKFATSISATPAGEGVIANAKLSGEYDGDLFTASAGAVITVTAGNAKIADNLPNAYQDKYVKVSYTVGIAAIQYDNIEVGTAYSELDTALGA